MAIFAEVIKHGSFKKAGSSLSLSPSVVSYHVAQLERKTGVALIYRSTRRLTLTHDGDLFYQKVLNMLEAASDGIQLLSGNQEQPQRKIKVSLPTALSRSFINENIARFASHYPNIKLHIDYSDSRKNIIKDGIDLTIRAGELEDSDFIAKRIGMLKRVLVCSARHYRQISHPESIQDLEKLTWIELAQLSNERLFSRLHEHKTITFRSQITVNSVEAIYQYCLYGAGLAVLAESQVEDDIQKGRLIHLLPEWQVMPIPLFAIWPKNITSKSIVKRLISFISVDSV
ncbi:LysR family transcriptional regulator [Alteromonas sp. ALT199]|nr:LysR family transcriptional regulator [Alteromonas sp. ALT199]MBT3134876.1 LysR family transcriptional regulator [Alteromonas sp. ALT199]